MTVDKLNTSLPAITIIAFNCNWPITFNGPDLKHHRLTNTIHLTLKITSAQVVKTSVTNNNRFIQWIVLSILRTTGAWIIYVFTDPDVALHYDLCIQYVSMDNKVYVGFRFEFYFAFFQIVWFQKISIPPPQRELEILKGRGAQRPRKFHGGGGLYDRVSFQRDSRGPFILYGFECRSSCSKIFLTK